MQEKKEVLDLDDEDIDVIRKNKVAGQVFLRLNEEKLMQIGLPLGPVESIAHLIEIPKGGEGK